MNRKTLNLYLHDRKSIELLQRDYLKVYQSSQKNPQIAGTYKGRDYIRLKCDNEAMIRMGSNQVLVIINWPDQITPYHVHDWIEVQYMYSGSCEVTLLDKTIMLKEGQFVMLDTDAPHAVGKTDQDNILINIAFDKQYLLNYYFTRVSKSNVITEFFVNALNQKVAHQKYIIFTPGNKEKLHFLVESLLCEFYTPSILAEDILNSYLTLILCELAQTYAHSDEKSENGNMMLVAILRYIENNYLQCTLESTANFF